MKVPEESPHMVTRLHAIEDLELRSILRELLLNLEDMRKILAEAINDHEDRLDAGGL